MRQAERLTGERALVVRQEIQRIRDILNGRKYAVYRVAQHDVLDDFLFRNAEVAPARESASRQVVS